jgi:negative regulator of sigma E activity
VDTSERLAAFAAGDLSPDEQRALEAELARDPAMRAELSSIRQLDERLAKLTPAAPSADFQAQLRSAVRAELAELAPVASLAQARAQRRWSKPLGAVAAAAALMGIVTVGLGNLLSSSDQDATSASMESGAADPLADTEGASDQSQASGASAPGPPVYAEGGDYDRGNLEDLGGRGDIRAALGAAQGDPANAKGLNLSLLADQSFAYRQEAIGTGSPDEAAADGAEAFSGPALDSPTQSRSLSDIITRCVPIILDGDRVPLFADLGTFEGAEALIVVLGSRNAAGDFSRLEFWVLDPGAECEVRFFAQNG